MCGIAGILLTPMDRPPEMLAEMRELFTNNLKFNEERGRSASGVAVMQADGRLLVEKSALSASEFVETEAFSSALRQIGPCTTLVLGHARHPTKGDPAWMQNNHPLQAGPVVGVHNGHIRNDDDLFSQYNLPRLGQVDSEVIFRLIETCPPLSQPRDYLASLRPLLRSLQGDFTFLAADRRAPERLVVLKHANPLCLHYHAPWHALLFSSRYIFLRKAFGFSITTEALPHDQMLLFEARWLPEMGSQPAAQLPFVETPEVRTGEIWVTKPY